MPRPRSCIIIGAGPAGLVAALALQQRAGITAIIYERSSGPSTIGGAINLTPNALALLANLGIEAAPGCPTATMEFHSLTTGAKLGELPLHNRLGVSHRVLRADLQRVLLDRVRAAGIELVFGAMVLGIDEAEKEGGSVTVRFADGTAKETDLLLGCDGVFSTVRSGFVEPQRKPIYLGPAAGYTVLRSASIKAPIVFNGVAAFTGQHSTTLASFCDAEKTQIFLGVVVEFEDLPADREEWAIWRDDTEKTCQKIREQFAESRVECVKEMAEHVDELFFFPILQLPAGGRWSRGNVLLLGDAAHAMPPQGESSGFAMEDGVLLARVFEEFPSKTVAEVLATYESTRRPRIDEALRETTKRNMYGAQRTWLKQVVIEWGMWAYLWWTRGGWEKSITYDVQTEELAA